LDDEAFDLCLAFGVTGYVCHFVFLLKSF
jgi:hypothetical protein